jgi:phenylpyruvate tautomerase PptA (4-oxalocrotonate tautomerase family)
MPYLQLDVPGPYPIERKQELARRIGAIFAEIMQTTPEHVTVSFRELGEGSIWRCGEGEPEPAAVLMCDIRRGRPPEQRARLAEALVAACVDGLGLRRDRLAVEFTQHAGDEMYKAERGGLTADWTADEARPTT